MNQRKPSYAELKARLAEAETAMNRAGWKVDEGLDRHANELEQANERLRKEIHEARQIQQELEECRRKFHLFVDNVPALIAHLDADQRFVLANRQFKTWFGADPAEVTGQHIRQFLGEEAYSQLQGYVEEVLQGRQVSFERPVSFAQGGRRWIKADFVPDVDASGRIGGFFMLAGDFSKQKETEQALVASEERYRNLVDTAADAIICSDQQGIIQTVNRAAEKLFDYGRDELIGRSVNILIPVADRDQHDDHLAPYLRTGAAKIIGVGREVRGLRKGGTIIPLHISIGEFYLNGEPYFTAIIQNISQQKETEQALKDSLAIQKSITDCSPDYIVMLDPDGVIRFINRTRYLPIEQVIGSSAYDRLSPPFRQKVADCFARVAETKEIGQFQVDYRLPTGDVRSFEARVAPMIRDGEVAALVVNASDITQQKRASEARQALIDELQARNAEMERFAYTVSHDLKRPLITIRGFLGLLEKDLAAGNAERIDHDFRRINDAAERMETLLNDLLELSRTGHVISPFAEVSLHEIASEAVGLVGDIAGKGVQVEIARDLPRLVGDRGRLLEVLQNLLENAVKFMGDQPHPRIEIGVRSDGEETVCYVRDNGIGIDGRFHKKIFGLFDRLDPQTDGTGIGLALVKRIIETHGGRVWVESEGRGLGSTFCFTIPGSEHARDNNGQREAERRTTDDLAG